MDRESARIIRRVWKHSKVDGYVWMPTIQNIGKPNQRFNNGPALRVEDDLGKVSPAVDSYWTPAVRKHTDSPKGKSRDATGYGPQRVVWADCDDNYDEKMLRQLRPSFMWETSPGHMQAVWLMRDSLSPSEFSRDGFMGMLADALGADSSGVDVPQLLRVPGSWHNKKGRYHGTIHKTQPAVHTRGQLLTRVARGLGLSPGVASDLGAEDPWGDRSALLWKFARSAAEAGVSEELAFKLIKACAWNKWKDNPDRLREDISKAYAKGTDKPDKPADKAEDESGEEEITAWELDTVADFGPVLNAPVKWIIPDIIAESAVGLLVAAPKVGKTRLAMEMALGLATGDSPLGLKVHKPMNVGYLSLEDGQYLFAERLQQTLNSSRKRFPYHWQGHITVDLQWHPPAPMGLFTMFESADLRTGEDQQRLYETILKYNLNLVIIDTLSMAIGDANVSDQKEMYALLKPIKVMAKATGCAIMLVHHTRKRVFEKGESVQERILGATALHGWSDFILSLSNDPDEDSDLLRLGVQTKRGTASHWVTQSMLLVKKPKVDD